MSCIFRAAILKYWNCSWYESYVLIWVFEFQRGNVLVHRGVKRSRKQDNSESEHKVLPDSLHMVLWSSGFAATPLVKKLFSFKFCPFVNGKLLLVIPKMFIPPPPQVTNAGTRRARLQYILTSTCTTIAGVTIYTIVFSGDASLCNFANCLSTMSGTVTKFIFTYLAIA